LSGTVLECFIAKQVSSWFANIFTIVIGAVKRWDCHAHNNWQTGVRHTIEAIVLGANMLDDHMAGLGRGAGNAKWV